MWRILLTEFLGDLRDHKTRALLTMFAITWGTIAVVVASCCASMLSANVLEARMPTATIARRELMAYFLGPLGFLVITAVLFILTTLGSGILISTVARTQQQALFATWFLLVFFLLMSGFLFPIANMPRGMQLVTHLDPVRYFVTAVRGILMKRAGLDLLWPQAVALTAFGIGTLAISSWRFRRVTGS